VNLNLPTTPGTPVSSRAFASTTRARRDHEKYLTPIDTITLLHQPGLIADC